MNEIHIHRAKRDGRSWRLKPSQDPVRHNTRARHRIRSGRAALFLMSLVAASMIVHGQSPSEPRSQRERQTKSPRVLARPDDTALAVIQQAQPNNARPHSDVLVLRNGEKLAGAVQNESYRLRTPYATVALDRRCIAEIDLKAEPHQLATISTVNQNRFSAFLEDSSFAFLPAEAVATAPIEVRREKVKLFLARDSAAAAIPKRQFVLLKNGDFFTGKLLLDPIPLQTGAGVIEIRKAAMDSIKFIDAARLAVQVTGIDGSVREGTLVSEDLEFELDVGPVVRIYHGHIELIYGREGYVPPGLAITRSAAPSLAAPHSPGDSSASGASGTAGSAAPNALSETMVWIPAGEFVMGSHDSERDRDLDEGPQTRVTISHGFWMGKFEVTQGDYESVLGNNPSQFRGDARRPVEKVNWYDALKYCARLTQIHESTGKLPAGYAYRLPTEAEWEYACRAGTTTRFSFGNDPIYLWVGDHAWFNGNSSSSPQPVGTKKPNPWGLFDMHGNVLEWCLDTWAGTLPGEAVVDRPISASGSLRVARGGSWLYEARQSRSANRDDYSPSNQCSDLGFRVVLAPIEQ